MWRRRPRQEREAPPPVVPAQGTTGPAPRDQEPAAAPGDGFDDARAALARGDAHGAVAVLRARLREGERPPPMDVLAGLGRLTGTAMLSSAAVAPPTGRSLRDVGYALIDLGLSDVAVPVLREAVRLAPGEDTLGELVTSLDDTDRHAESLQVLLEHPAVVQRSPVLGYLLAFEHVVTGDLDGARRARAALVPAGDEVVAGMHERLDRMLSRAEAIAAVSPLDATDLRGWHFVVTGGLLVARAPRSHEGMNGRWAFVQDSYENVAAGVWRTLAVLDRLDMRPPAVVGLPDRGSQAMAAFTAVLAGVASVPWPPEGPALVVAHDLAQADDDALRHLAVHAPGQPLHVHAASWTSPPAFAPDLTAVLHQVAVPPWGERMVMRVEGDRREVDRLPADDAPAEVLAGHLLDADPGAASFDEEPLEDLLRLADAVRGVAAVTRPSGARDRFFAASPVGSSRFA